VAEKLLDRAQVASAGEEMRREEWRSACGVALSGRPSAPRISATAYWIMRGDSGAALGADEQRPLGLEHIGAEREVDPRRRGAPAGSVGTLRILPPLPTTVTESVAATGASRRLIGQSLGDAQARA
jgi:hypothetical protein